MTRNIQQQAHKASTNARNQRQADLRTEADAVLRDIAFVLKMTQRVRDEIETDEVAREPALA